MRDSTKENSRERWGLGRFNLGANDAELFTPILATRTLEVEEIKGK